MKSPLKKNQAHIGQTYEILIEPAAKKKSSQNAVGRADNNKLVILQGAPGLPQIGDIVKVKITQATPHALKGEVLVK